MVSAVPGVRLSTKNEGVRADELATRMPESSLKTSKLKVVDWPPSNPGIHSMPIESVVWFTTTQFCGVSGLPDKFNYIIKITFAIGVHVLFSCGKQNFRLMA